MRSFNIFQLTNTQSFSADLGLTTIVDVGAQVLDTEDHIYKPLAEAVPSRVIGFEPVEEARVKRETGESGSDTVILPYAVGNGATSWFYETVNSALSSVYPPNADYRKRFIGGHRMYNVREKSKLKTIRLDDVEEFQSCDYLKLDVQGGELNIIEGATNLLKSLPVIHTEAFFLPFYQGAPLWSDLDPVIRDAGFELIDIFPGRKRYSAFGDAKDKIFDSNLAGPSRIVWADFLYLKTSALLGELNSTKLRRAALAMHFIYGKYDVAATILGAHDEKHGTNFLEMYIE